MFTYILKLNIASLIIAGYRRLFSNISNNNQFSAKHACFRRISSFFCQENSALYFLIIIFLEIKPFYPYPFSGTA